MISSDLPHFFAFVDVKLKNTYLVHVDKFLIKDGLKKIRECQKKNKQLHESNMLINPHKRNAIFIGSNESLKEHLLSIIGSSPSDYARDKSEYRKKIGYENGMFKVKGAIKDRDLMDVQLGLIDSANVEFSVFNNIRFNIELPYPEHPESISIISDNQAYKLGLISKEDFENATLTVRNKNSQIPHEIKGILRVSHPKDGVITFNNEYFKLLLDNKGTEKILSITVMVENIFESEMTIKEFKDILEVIQTLSDNDGFFLSLAFKGMELATEHKINQSISRLKKAEYCLSIMDSVYYLMRLLKVNNNVKFKPESVFFNNVDYKFFDDFFVSKKSRTIRLSGVSDYFKNKERENIDVVMLASFVFLECCYIVSVLVEGEFILSDDYAYCCDFKSSVICTMKYTSSDDMHEFCKQTLSACRSENGRKTIIMDSGLNKDLFDIFNTSLNAQLEHKK